MHFSLPKLLLCVSIPLIIGAVSSYVTVGGVEEWYPLLSKPFFTPPSWIFGPVWTILYVMIGISGYSLWEKAQTLKKIPIGIAVLYIGQLLLNGLWSIVFFGMQNIGAALVIIVILWSVLILLIIDTLTYKPIAGKLLLPYFIWVSFASILNYGFFILQ